MLHPLDRVNGFLNPFRDLRFDCFGRNSGINCLDGNNRKIDVGKRSMESSL